MHSATQLIVTTAEPRTLIILDHHGKLQRQIKLPDTSKRNIERVDLSPRGDQVLAFTDDEVWHIRIDLNSLMAQGQSVGPAPSAP